MAYHDTADWEKVNGTTSRLDVPGGYLYRVAPGGQQPTQIVFVADLPGAIVRAAYHLGTGVAATEMGALEAHAVQVKEASERLADGLRDLAAALRRDE